MNQNNQLNDNDEQISNLSQSLSRVIFPSISCPSISQISCEDCQFKSILMPNNYNQLEGDNEKDIVNTYHSNLFKVMESKQMKIIQIQQKLQELMPEKQKTHKNKYIFKEIFVQNHHQRKNSNFTKLLLTIFNKHNKKQWIQGLAKKQYESKLQEAREKYERNGKRNIQIGALSILFGASQDHQSFTQTNRIILYNLLGSQQVKEYIIMNPFSKQKNKIQHLLASKFYRMRCRSKLLTARTQTK